MVTNREEGSHFNQRQPSKKKLEHELFLCFFAVGRKLLIIYALTEVGYNE